MNAASFLWLAGHVLDAALTGAMFYLYPRRTLELNPFRYKFGWWFVHAAKIIAITAGTWLVHVYDNECVSQDAHWYRRVLWALIGAQWGVVGNNILQGLKVEAGL